MRTFDLILPNLAQLMVLAALTVVVLLIMGLGRLESGGVGRAAAMVTGWGGAVFVFVVTGTLTALPFDVIAACLAAPSLVGLGLLVWDRSWGDPAWRRAGRIVVLSVPLILVVVGMRVSQWDELAQWLPNTQFLIAQHRFPSAALPNPGSTLPGYPYALPLVGYVTSLLPGGSSDRAGLLFNLWLLLAVGFALAALPEARWLGRRALSGLLILPLPLVTAFLWQRYAAAELPTGTMTMLPFAQWHFEQLGDTLRSMLGVVVGKGGLFGLLTALLILAAMTLRRPGLLDKPARMLCRITAFVFVGYMGFLLFAYISTFNDYEGLHAASFWRYSTHLGMIGVVSATAAVVPYWRLRPRLRRGLAAIAIAIVLILPAAAVKRLRFDIVHPHDGYLLAVARDIGSTLPAGARVELVDLHYDGSNLQLMRYKLLFCRRTDGNLPETSVTGQTGH